MPSDIKECWDYWLSSFKQWKQAWSMMAFLLGLFLCGLALLAKLFLGRELGTSVPTVLYLMGGALVGVWGIFILPYLKHCALETQYEREVAALKAELEELRAKLDGTLR